MLLYVLSYYLNTLMKNLTMNLIQTLYMLIEHKMNIEIQMYVNIKTQKINCDTSSARYKDFKVPKTL